MQLQAFLDQLGARWESDGWVARCPAHSDSRASLRITTTDKVLVICRAGCSTPEVMKAAGLTIRDLVTMELGTAANATRSGLEPPSEANLVALEKYTTTCYGVLSPQTISYAESRFGASVTDLAHLNIGTDDGSISGGGLILSPSRYHDVPRMTVPFYDLSGRVHYVQSRALEDSEVRWSGPADPEGRCWGKYGWFSGQTGWAEVLITEGPGDAITAAVAGFDALAIRGANVAKTLLDTIGAELAERLEGRIVVVAGDADRAGQGFNTALIQGLKKWGIEARQLEIPKGADDITEWRERDPEGFKQDFVRAVRQAKAARADEEVEISISGDLSQLWSDVYNARCLLKAIRRTGKDIMWLPEMGWIVYDPKSGKWSADSSEWIRSQAHNIATDIQGEIYAEAAQAEADAELLTDEGIRSRVRALAERTRKKASSSLVAYVRSSRGIDCMLRELQVLAPGRLTEFDQNPNILLCANGVVDLQTGKLTPLSPHTKELRLMRGVSVVYRPDARCPRWEKFLLEIFPGHPELAEYVQTLIGYGITGSTAEQAFAIMYGQGANGKSVLTTVLTKVFAGITQVTPFSTFEAKLGGGIPNDVAALNGARIVISSEGDANKKMAEATLKLLTGGTPVTARFMRAEFFTFQPAFLLLLETNHKPKFQGQDEGLWRRIRFIPFNRFFRPEERDRHLVAKFTGGHVPTEGYIPGEDYGDRAEGILSWAVQGAVRYYREGLIDPPVVLDAVDAYRHNSDGLGGFIGPQGPVVLDPHGKIHERDLWNAYLEWAMDEGLSNQDKWRKSTFLAAMEERGLARRDSVFSGIRNTRPSDRKGDLAPPPIQANGSVF